MKFGFNIKNIFYKFSKLIILFSITLLFKSCYSFTGGSVPEHLKSIQITNVNDNSGFGNPLYREEMSRLIINRFRNDNSFSIYPNPAITEFNILIKSAFVFNDLNYMVFDISGTILMQGDIKESKTSIETSDFTSGLYFIKLFDNFKMLNCYKLSIIKP
ncbi:MAG: T9SS type A sorting domain-containing protein [Candidatus Kapaibacteriota bacterium]